MKNVLSLKMMKECENYTIENICDSKKLMYRVGKGIFESCNFSGRIAIICGYGNNAGDGFVLAELLHKAEKDVTVYILENKFSDDGKYYYDVCLKEKVNIKKYDLSIDFSEYNIIVDALFGTGFKGSIKDDLIINLINAVNNSGKTVISIDINSGLNGDNGHADIAVRSDITFSTGFIKTGHLLNDAKDYIGELRNLDIGIKLIGNPYYLFEDTDLSEIFCKRKSNTSKVSYGRALIIGGCKNYSGAAKLANLSLCALKSGAGLSGVLVPKSISVSVSNFLLESILYEIDDEDGFMKFNKNDLDFALRKVNSVAFGMGLGNGKDNERILFYLLQNYKNRLLIDADGINTLAKMDKDLLKKAECEIILTPHIDEFSRISGYTNKEILENPIELTKKFATEYNVTLLLKGSTTIVTNGEIVYLCDKGCPGMATAGSGDVLSGIISGINSFSKFDITLNAVCGAYVAGMAGMYAQQEFGEVSMTSKDTVDNIYKVITNFDVTK